MRVRPSNVQLQHRTLNLYELRSVRRWTNKIKYLSVSPFCQSVWFVISLSYSLSRTCTIMTSYVTMTPKLTRIMFRFNSITPRAVTVTSFSKLSNVDISRLKLSTFTLPMKTWLPECSDCNIKLFTSAMVAGILDARIIRATDWSE